MKIVKNSIGIQADAAKVWDALTNPAQTKKYMFGCEVLTDWEVGSPMHWQAIYEGNEMVFVKGYVLAIDPGVRLRYSVIDPNAEYPHTPENHLNVTYELIDHGDHTELIVTQDGFENAYDGERRFAEVQNNGDGWNPILEAIKNIVEVK